MSPAASRRLFAALLGIGLCVRLAALPLPGTGDIVPFKIWSHAASTSGVAQMYGVGGSPPERRLHAWGGFEATVNYPPVALYELAVVGWMYRAAFPDFPDSVLLTCGIKLLPLAAEAAMAWLLFLAVRRVLPEQPAAARFAALAFWLNPAAVLITPVLGYVDALFALPALASLVAASNGHPALAGGMLAIAVLTKPQAVLFVPVVGLAVLGWTQARRWLPALQAPALAAAAAAVTGGVVLAPVVAAGAWPNFLQAMASFSRHDMLSGQAANVWWIVTYVMRAAYAVAEMGVAGAYLSPVRRPLGITRIVELGYPNPRLAATLAVTAAIGWALWRGRRVRDLPRLALLGAWSVYAYFMLSVQVHENHFYLMLPALALAAAALPDWRTPFWVLSGICALNLNLFYGFGNRVGFAVPRTLTGIDATVWLSIANVAAFVWFARRLGRCLASPGPLARAGRAGIPRRRESSSR
jgi:Gpi18-like mannosyltransferase